MLNVSGVPAQQPNLQYGPLPQQIVASKVLEMPVDQLDQHLRQEAAQNPALEIPEDPECPFCGTPLEGGDCPACSLRALDSLAVADWLQPVQFFDGEYEAEQDPVNRVAEDWSLKQDLLLQLSVTAEGQTFEVGAYIIECLTEDGYLLEPLIDIADRFRLSVPQVEEVLKVVQRLDPAGVGARDLRECLLLQLERMENRGDTVRAARTIVSEHWKHLCANRTDKIAAAMGMSVECVRKVMKFIQTELVPCPGRGFRADWSHLSPQTVPVLRPDVVILRGERGLEARVVDPWPGRLRLSRSFEAVHCRNRGVRSEDLHGVRSYVAQARALIDAVARRSLVLLKITNALIGFQRDFLLEGPAKLKPLTKKELAKAVGMHESVVCRATVGKHVRIPSGEVVSFDCFFDGSLAAKDALRAVIAAEPPDRPLSDAEIAEELRKQGFVLARRTVAKYRESLGLLPADLRRR